MENSARHNINTKNKHVLTVLDSCLHKVTNSLNGQHIQLYYKISVHIQNLPFIRFKTSKTHILY